MSCIFGDTNKLPYIRVYSESCSDIFYYAISLFLLALAKGKRNILSYPLGLIVGLLLLCCGQVNCCYVIYLSL